MTVWHRIMSALETAAALNNTLVLFLSDNGTRAETNDLAADQPERVKRLNEHYARYATASGVKPWSLLVQSNKESL